MLFYTGSNLFEVDEKNGHVRTKTSEDFMLDMEYVLFVKAEDENGTQSEEERLSIVGGNRPPQFFMPRYEKKIFENTTVGSEYVPGNLIWFFFYILQNIMYQI